MKNIIVYTYIYIYALVGGIPTHLKNMSSSIGMMKFPTKWKNKIHVPNHQPKKYIHTYIYIYVYISHVSGHFLFNPFFVGPVMLDVHKPRGCTSGFLSLSVLVPYEFASNLPIHIISIHILPIDVGLVNQVNILYYICQ